MATKRSRYRWLIRIAAITLFPGILNTGCGEGEADLDFPGNLEFLRVTCYYQSVHKSCVEYKAGTGEAAASVPSDHALPEHARPSESPVHNYGCLFLEGTFSWLTGGMEWNCSLHQIHATPGLLEPR
jgi:hypothetical protein